MLRSQIGVWERIEKSAFKLRSYLTAEHAEKRIKEFIKFMKHVPAKVEIKKNYLVTEEESPPPVSPSKRGLASYL